MTYYSKITYTVSVETDTFAIPFEYLEQNHLSVSVDDAEKTRGVDYDIVGTDVVFGSNIAVAAEVLLDRTTPIATDELSVTFVDGGSIKGADLNAASRQSIFSLQEVSDDATVLTADIEGAAKVVNNLSDLASAATARSNLDLYTTAEVDAKTDGLALKANNLSDLTNDGTARANLDVYSKAETEAQISTISGALQITNDLSDVQSVGASRTNLEVYSTTEIDTAIDASVDGLLLLEDNLGGVGSEETSRTNLNVYSRSEVDAKIAYIQDQLPDVDPPTGLLGEYEVKVISDGEQYHTIAVPTSADYFTAQSDVMPFSGAADGKRVSYGARLTTGIDRLILISNADSDAPDCESIIRLNEADFTAGTAYTRVHGNLTIGQPLNFFGYPALITGESDDVVALPAATFDPKLIITVVRFYAGTP